MKTQKKKKQPDLKACSYVLYLYGITSGQST